MRETHCQSAENRSTNTHTRTHTAKQQKIITIIIKTAEYKQKAAFYEWRAPETDSDREGRQRGGKSKLWNSKNRTPQVLASVRIRRCHSHSHSHSRCRCRRQSNVSGFIAQRAQSRRTNVMYKYKLIFFFSKAKTHTPTNTCTYSTQTWQQRRMLTKKKRL